MQWFDDFGRWFGSWNWGDVPGWLSLAGAVVIGLTAYLRRSRIFAWFRRATNAPPSFESQPSWELRQEGRECHVTNHGPGEAFDVRFSIPYSDRVGQPSLMGQYNWDSVQKDETVTVLPSMDPYGLANCYATLKVSWILRHDPGVEVEREEMFWSLDTQKWFEPVLPSDDLSF